MSKYKRRDWIKKSFVTTAGIYTGIPVIAKNASLNINKGVKPTAIVVGAGIMGSWTAYFLTKSGYKVIILDSWGAGNPRASSGGESRIIRYMYGENEIYFNLARRSMQLWKEEEKQIGQQLFFQNGMLIFSEKPTYEYAEISRPYYEKAGLTLKKIKASQLIKEYPYLNVQDLDHGIYDPDAGYLLAADSCRAIVKAVEQRGGDFQYVAASSGEIRNNKMSSIDLYDGSKLKADLYVFANGPWLGKSFPTLLEGKLKVTRQPVFFFGAPQNFAHQSKAPFPVWMNRDTANMERCYGIFDPQLNGFKLAYTQLEEVEIDPSIDERIVQKREIAHARYLMEKRFNFMKDAPLLLTKVCQHTDTPDKNFLIDQHPEANNVWMVGGGSGHAFKHGPAIGELVTQLALEKVKKVKTFSLSRLSSLENFTKSHK